jgi:endonuclease III
MHTIIADRDIRKWRARRVLRELKKKFPTPVVSLDYGSEWEFLVAVMLSAQCTDKRVNQATASLFKKYRTLEEYAHASTRVFARDIRTVTYFNTKARHIIATAQKIIRDYTGKVPDSFEALLALPGVGRKTAHVVLHELFEKAEGIAVDTHVKRLAQKTGLTSAVAPEKIAHDLEELFPRKEWRHLTLRCIAYGRTVCPARRHDCSAHLSALGIKM